jgi:hypothetical protein
MQKLFGNNNRRFRFRPAASLALVAGVLVLQGCEKKPAAQTAQPTASASAAGSEQADMSAVLGQLTQALRKYSFEHRHVPTTFSELAAAGNLGATPAAPAGKKFAIDAKAVQVILVNQ